MHVSAIGEQYVCDGKYAWQMGNVMGFKYQLQSQAQVQEQLPVHKLDLSYVLQESR